MLVYQHEAFDGLPCTPTEAEEAVTEFAKAYTNNVETITPEVIVTPGSNRFALVVNIGIDEGGSETFDKSAFRLAKWLSIFLAGRLYVQAHIDPPIRSITRVYPLTQETIDFRPPYAHSGYDAGYWVKRMNDAQTCLAGVSADEPLRLATYLREMKALGHVGAEVHDALEYLGFVAPRASVKSDALIQVKAVEMTTRSHTPARRTSDTYTEPTRT